MSARVQIRREPAGWSLLLNGRCVLREEPVELCEQLAAAVRDPRLLDPEQQENSATPRRERGSQS